MRVTLYHVTCHMTSHQPIRGRERVSRDVPRGVSRDNEHVTVSHSLEGGSWREKVGERERDTEKNMEKESERTCLSGLSSVCT